MNEALMADAKAGDSSETGTLTPEDPIGTAWGWGLPAAAAATGLLLALLSLGTRDLWLDEAATVTSTNQLATALNNRSGSMALHYILMTPWSSISLDAAWLRLPSAMFAALAVAGAVRLALCHLGRRVAVWTAVFLIPMWGVTRYAQEVRSYALAMALAVMSWMLFLRLAQHERFRDWCLWVICGAGLVYSHPLAGLILVAQLAVMLSDAPRAEASMLRRSERAWMLLTLLVSPMAASVAMGSGAAPDWVPPLEWSVVADATTMLAGPWAAAQITLSVALAAATVMLVASHPDRRLRSLPLAERCVLAWMWIPPTALLLVSTVKPMFLGRYLAIALPAAALLLALGLSRIRAAHLRWSFALLLGLGLISGQAAVHTAQGHRWSAAITHIEEQLGEDESHGIMFLGMTSRLPFEINAHGRPILQDTVPVAPAEPWGTLVFYHEAVTAPELERRTAGLDTVWVVAHVFTQPLTLNSERLNELGFCLSSTAAFPRPVEVSRFDRCPAELDR